LVNSIIYYLVTIAFKVQKIREVKTFDILPLAYYFLFFGFTRTKGKKEKKYD